ncbi:CDP-glycerol glycerophosphotransferase family protein [Campylobacter jejuni]|uniref:CDP-glycerol glycerophosphotransferase family protein n=1 Tax=Campylobacter jejuni TaxID=197 RepID=UPI000F80D1E3|nr:CDP-glycerol glycerophosphotransferase family protein [Campylobacter jejuni]RTJ70572.1 capsular biosynthesis protein [Campylobacter jejuni]
MSILKKTKKLFKDPKLFFKDAIEKKVFWLSGVYNKYLPKKHKGFTQYTIISAVYNVEKYLDDYFDSIINQRLDFKKNIFMILVDDGSTDNSANIIKKYQKKYPKNIVYLYKENGGQASARNLGLKYMQENNYKTPWVTFTDPDDFLDRNYFYEVDKFLSTHQDDDICMIVPNLILFYDGTKEKKQHPLSKTRKFNQELVEINNMLDFRDVIVSIGGVIFNRKKIGIKNRFQTNIKPCFEDSFFINQILLENIFSNIHYSDKISYFYRKRSDGTSTIDNLKNSFEYYFNVPYYGTLKLARYSIIKTGIVMRFIQFVNLYFFTHQILPLVNNSDQFQFGDFGTKYLELLSRNFKYIDKKTIITGGVGINFFYQKIGLIGFLKKEQIDFNIVYIDKFDECRKSILIKYYTSNPLEVEVVKIDNKICNIEHEKRISYRLLNSSFVYEKRIWVYMPKYDFGKLKIQVGEYKTEIKVFNKLYSELDVGLILRYFYRTQSKYYLKNTLVFMDQDIEADNNAEKLYRYVQKYYPQQKIIFLLSKKSKDWDRLKKENFNLIDCYSDECREIVKHIKYFISSFNPRLFGIKLEEQQNFLFLGHGVDKNDLSLIFNSQNIRMRFSSSTDEYNSLVANDTTYNFTKKEVVLTGMPRHDDLIKGNVKNTKTILIMPTWRMYLNTKQYANEGRKIRDGFLESTFFQSWIQLLSSKKLELLCNKYGYKVLFAPHFNMRDMLDFIMLPEYIINAYKKNNSFQENFQKSDLMITDYTSAAFEMAYLQKPVIYYQFDEQDFLSNHYKQGYFDYRRDGFGPVVASVDEVLNELEVFMKHNSVEERYYVNMKNTFPYRDGRCCERVYNAILAIQYSHNREYDIKIIYKKLIISIKQSYIDLALEYFKVLYQNVNCNHNKNKIMEAIFMRIAVSGIKCGKTPLIYNFLKNNPSVIFTHNSESLRMKIHHLARNFYL